MAAATNFGEGRRLTPIVLMVLGHMSTGQMSTGRMSTGRLSTGHLIMTIIQTIDSSLTVWVAVTPWRGSLEVPGQPLLLQLLMRLWHRPLLSR